MVIAGIGIGSMMQVFVLSVQNAVPRSMIGSATALTQFARQMGATIGVTVMGAIVNHGLPAGVAVPGEGTAIHRLPGASRAPARRRDPARVLRRRLRRRADLGDRGRRRPGAAAAPLTRRDLACRGRRGSPGGAAGGGLDSGLMGQDFMPLDGWDHVELWVGNAKQAAYYYEHAFGFHRTAYAGPETGVRDRASYVLEQARCAARRDECAPSRSRDRRIRTRARRRGQGHLAAGTRRDRGLSPGGAARRPRDSSSRSGSRTTTAGSSSRRSGPTATSSTRS